MPTPRNDTIPLIIAVEEIGDDEWAIIMNINGTFDDAVNMATAFAQYLKLNATPTQRVN